MNDFDYDVLQKKKIARNAKYRKSTYNRKGCTLPHEYMSKKEIQAMNGELSTIQMNSPMSWERFKTLPPDLQREYLQKQMDRFGVGLNAIGVDMFGLGRNRLGNWTKTRNMKFDLRTGGRTSNAALQSWRRWLNNAPEEEAQETVTEAPIAPIMEVEEVEEMLKEPDEDMKLFRAHDYELPRFTVDKVQPNPCQYPMTNMNLSLKGTPTDILTALRMSFPTLLDAESEYRFTISIERRNRCAEDWRPDHL